jgi:hypothetical protein
MDSRMTAHTPSLSALASETALSPDALISGPGALPVAPLAMPHQVIEQERGLIRRLLCGLHLQAAPNAGIGH